MASKVAFIGLGVMGYPMAGHLANKGGHQVTVYNRTGAGCGCLRSLRPRRAPRRPFLPGLRVGLR